MIATAYQDKAAALENLIRTFDTEGEVLHSGRNEVRLMQLDGEPVVVKRFARLSGFKSIIYTFFRKNKAQRAFEYGEELLRRGFLTPQPIAFFALKPGGLISDTFYICKPTDWSSLEGLLTSSEEFDHQLAAAYARFVAKMHDAGILHKDMNPGNTRYQCADNGAEKAEGEYQFQVIDINRMKITEPGGLTKAECMENLTHFWWLSPLYRYILDEYAAARGWTAADKAKAIRVKDRHDAAWVRRKNILSLLKYGELEYQ